MNKLMEIVVYILAVIGLACVVKHIHISNCREGCCICNSFKSKTEKSRTKAEEFKTKAGEFRTKAEGFKTKVEGFKEKVHGTKTKEEGEKRAGSRYGSNPVRY
ncbi:hypothetical protein RSJ42_13235 [Methanosarcina hadiensis]|uniref:hypothetical protein n=1 Tax=Methanosarcina hadiensis TaxID=3078083 RepID=UPI003977BCCE